MKRLLLVLAPVICLGSSAQAELMPVGNTGWYSSFDSITLRIPAMPPRHTDLMPPGIPG